ncbi:MAG: restriction endonuclease [Betaproteobacteria bacterium]
MQWKMSDQSLFAILLRSPWWISAAIAVALASLSFALLRDEWRYYGVFVAAPFVVIASVALWRSMRAPSAKRVASTLVAVRAMSWGDFSSALEDGFRRDGYEVSRIPGAAADFEIAKGGRRAVVAGKRWKVARTGIEPLRDLDGAKDARDAHESIYVVAGELTDNAREFAARKRIRLIGGAELSKLVPDAAATKPRARSARAA